MASTGELTGGTTAEEIVAAAREKVRQVAYSLAEAAIPNLRAMGFEKAAEALEGRDLKEGSLNAAVYAYANANGYTNQQRLEAQSSTWAIDRIAEMSTSDRRGVSPPITGPDSAGIGELYFGASNPTRDQLYTLLGLQEARDTAEPTRIELSLRSPGLPEPEIPPHLVGAYCEERRFTTGVPEVDIVESVNFRADGSPFNGEAHSYTVNLVRTDFGLVEA